MPATPTVVIAAFLLLASAAVARAGEHSRPPSPTPLSYSTHDYELTFAIPPGLYRCAAPAGWTAPDRGVTIYLLLPPGCHPRIPTLAYHAYDWPQIRVSYSANEFKELMVDGRHGLPRTNAELFAATCAPPDKIRADALRLFGRAVDACMLPAYQLGMAEVQALYRQSADRRKERVGPSSRVTITLQTTSRRFAEDWPKFRAIVASLRVCTAPDQPAAPPRPQCPPHEPW